MSGLIGCMIVLLFSPSFVVPSTMAQGEMSTQTIRGDLLSSRAMRISSTISLGASCLFTSTKTRSESGS
jgi:hypothetical protein